MIQAVRLQACFLGTEVRKVQLAKKIYHPLPTPFFVAPHPHTPYLAHLFLCARGLVWRRFGGSWCNGSGGHQSRAHYRHDMAMKIKAQQRQ